MSKFKDQLEREESENVLRSYGRFVDQFNYQLAAISEHNVKHMYNSMELPYSMPSVNCDGVTEITDLIELLQTCGNMQLNKVMLVFASLTLEMNSLSSIGVNQFCDALILYGEGMRNAPNEELPAIAKMLPLLHDLSCYVNHCYSVADNFIQQMNALITIANIPVKKGLNNSSKELIPELSPNVRFDVIYEAIADLALTLINLDEIIANQINLKRDFVNYKRIIELVCSNSAKFGLENDIHRVKSLFKVISRIEKELIDGEGIFKGFIDAMSNSVNGSAVKSVQLAEQFANFIKMSCNELETSSELITDRQWFSINVMFVIYVWLFKRDDKKLYKTISDCEKKIGVYLIHLKGNVPIIPDKFLANYLPRSMGDKRTIESFNVQRDAMLKQNFDREVNTINVKITHWMVRFEEEVNDINDVNSNLIESLAKQQKLIEEGLEFARVLSQLIKDCVALHLQSGRAMAKNDLVAICKAICILKGIQLIFLRKKSILCQILGNLLQYNCSSALKMLSAIQKKIIADVKKYSEKKLDLLSAVILACNCLNGPILTNQRRILTFLCLAFISQAISSEETQRLFMLIKKLDFLSTVYSLLNSWTNCEFLYFNRFVLGVYFNNFYENEASNVNELRHFFHALSDCFQFINKAHDAEQRQILLKVYEKDIDEQFKNEFLDKICTEFETELRLQIHSDLQLDDQSPFKRRLHDFSALLAAEPIRFGNKYISIKTHVESYLNEMAYNLTSIALHDWKTYESMLNLAKTKYDLEFVTSQIPTQTLEQGLDVLEITRNIHIFVSNYLYNLNNQMFIEKSSNNKHLNVLLIRHVANSISTHGFGIINTTVNFTYQFLRKKFYMFSQFLYEEHIKSRLIKDLRHFRESNATKFPFERAEKLAKGVRNLGLTADGMSYLDQFRQLISQIGNVLGFVRMLRSGALHCSSNYVNFVPDLDDLNEVSFEAMTAEESLSADTVKAAQNLDAILSTLNRNFTESTDYFKLLVDVFSSIFRDSKNYHLKNFYVILPATTYNFVEYSISSKEKMTRKNKVGAAFTDDGFAMGVAYILKLLDQFHDFKSLHWFASVRDKINSEMNEANKQSIANANSDVKLTQTTSLTLKRLEILQKEFDLLNYSLTSSQILFKATQDSKDL